MPATTIAPCGPLATMLSTFSSMASGPLSGVLIIDASLQGDGAQLVGFRSVDRRPGVAPCRANIAHDSGNLVVGKGDRERRHTMGHRVAESAGRIATVQHHADRVDGGAHLDRLVAGKQRIIRRAALAACTMA